MARDRSRDGFDNQLQTCVLTHGKPFWQLVNRWPWLATKVNKWLINNAIAQIPPRPHPFSLMTLETHSPYAPTHPKKQDTYTSWDSLSDRAYLGRHLPPNFEFNDSGKLPAPDACAPLFTKVRDNQGNPITRESDKSTLLFPYWVQWFTDGFLRTDRTNKLKNTSNHQIDLSPVYGLTPAVTVKLRAFQGGKLKSQQINGAEFPPYVYADPNTGQFKPEFLGLYDPLNEEIRQPPERKAKFFAMGVERANVQIGYVMFNVLCLREHNRLCDVLARAYPQWDDERLFQTARNIVIAELMKIVIEEYINHITPYHFKFRAEPLSFKNERWYRQNWMTLEFSQVYRWHSALPETFIYNGQPMTMFQSLWNNQLLIDRGLGPLFAETCTQPATRIGLFNTPEFLIESTEIASIRLGRLGKLASYNQYRELCKFPKVTDFDQITGDCHAQELLSNLYGHVDNLEFYVGLYAEDVRPNSALAALIGRMVGIDAFSQALTNPLLAEGIFNANTFSTVGWEIIQETCTLQELVNRNIPEASSPARVTFDRA
jgi:prostaglandin-endoperoxide synthase 2